MSSNDFIMTGYINVEDIPPQFTETFAAIPTSIAEIDARLLKSGRLIFRDAVVYIGEIDIETDTDFYLLAEAIVLERSIIVTNGNVLSVWCKDLRADADSKFCSFEGSASRAQVEKDGDYGSDVVVYTIDSLQTDLQFDLSGQSGGNGKDGKDGHRGREGRRGRRARNGPLNTCRNGPGRGHRGGRGLPGEDGTDGGDGGDGGNLRVYFVESHIPAGFSVSFRSQGGKLGESGKGGKGGQGGRGGLGGGNAGNCTPRKNPERNRGVDGPAGNDGRPGESGSSGKEGNSFIAEISVSELSSPPIIGGNEDT